MTWWHYLLLVNFYLVLFFGFYAMLLRRETFFQLNRVYLVAAALLSFVIPLIQADWVKNLFITQKVQHTIYSMPMNIPVILGPTVEREMTLGQIINGVYVTVAIFLFARLAWQLLILKKEIEQPTPSAAYTFFKKISLGENAAQSRIIAEHEQVHAGQWHSVDVMIIEMVMIINWFNPVVYLYRFAIKYIHEFIADSQVIKAGTDKADYALLLLSQTFDVTANNLVNQFYNHSLLKQRIMMLQKNKSQRVALAKYGLSAPLFMLMMIFSSATINNSTAVAAINAKTATALSTPVGDVANAIVNNAEIPNKSKPATETEIKIAETPMDAEVKPEPVDTVYSKVDQVPQFPGGLQVLGKFLSNNIKYPREDREAALQGKVFVKFVVEKDGSLSDVQAVDMPNLPSKASQAMKEEAVRVMMHSPKWTPGVKDGKKVRVSFVLPVAFMLDPRGNNTGKPTGAVSDDKSPILAAVDTQPQFPGGLENFGKFLAANIKYPKQDEANKTEGKVFLSFVVERDGTLSDVRAIRGPSQAMKDEAVRVLLRSPKWTPGYQNNVPVRVSYTVPIAFTAKKQGEASGAVIDSKGNLVGKNSKLIPGTSPLYVIDGVITDVTKNDKGETKSPLATIPQAEIERMEILKDETAKALYGDRGKYGVIIVTTKNAKKS